MDFELRLTSSSSSSASSASWASLYPEEYGGGGADNLSYAIAIEELARVDSSVAITVAANTSLGTWPIYAFGSEGGIHTPVAPKSRSRSGCRCSPAARSSARSALPRPRRRALQRRLDERETEHSRQKAELEEAVQERESELTTERGDSLPWKRERQRRSESSTGRGTLEPTGVRREPTHITGNSSNPRVRSFAGWERLNA